MNAKLCKRLRRQARSLSVGLPARRIIAGRNVAYRPNGERYFALRVENDPRSIRGIYRNLKRATA